MDGSVKKLALGCEWVGRPLMTRTQGEHLACHMGLTPHSTLEIHLSEGVIAVGGFWLGLCSTIVENCSTLAEAYSRIRLMEAGACQRMEFERAVCRAMGKVYTASD
jgi:hypothetical protein